MVNNCCIHSITVIFTCSFLFLLSFPFPFPFPFPVPLPPQWSNTLQQTQSHPPPRLRLQQGMPAGPRPTGGPPPAAAGAAARAAGHCSDALALAPPAPRASPTRRAFTHREGKVGSALRCLSREVWRGWPWPHPTSSSASTASLLHVNRGKEQGGRRGCKMALGVWLRLET
jgi:hypothetical protein